MKKFLLIFALMLTPTLAHAQSAWIYRWAITRSPARLNVAQTTITTKALPDEIPWAQTISYLAMYNPDLGLSAGYAETGLGWPAGGTYCRNLARKREAPIAATCIWYADEANGHTMAVIGRVKVGTPVTVKMAKNTNNTVTATYQWAEEGIIKNLSKTMSVGQWTTGNGRIALEVEVDTNSLYNSSFWGLPANAKPGNIHFLFTNTTLPDPTQVTFWSSESGYFNTAGSPPYAAIAVSVTPGTKY